MSRPGLGRPGKRTTDLRKTYMCSICLPQSGQAPASHVSRQQDDPSITTQPAFGPCKQIPSFTMSISKTPASYKAAKLVYEVLNGHMPEPAQHLFKNGGARRDRTDDLKLAKLPLSQLSYGPVSTHPGSSPSGQPQSWWAWEDLNFRPHAYQARALTN